MKRSTLLMEDTANRQTAYDLKWASDASLNTVNFGSSVKIDEKTYQLLSAVDEEEDRRKNSKNNETTASDLALSNVKSNGVGLVPFRFNSV